MYHYTYLITYSNGMKYMGVRSSKCLPKDDSKYIGSSKHTPTKEYVLSKEVLAEFPSRQLAVEAEIEYHQTHQVAENVEFYNKAKQTSTKFDTTGFAFERTKEHCAKISQSLKGRVRTDEERYAISKAKKGIKRGPHTAEFKAMVSKVHKGKIVSKESIEKMVITRKTNDSYKHSDLTKAKIIQSLIKNPPFVSPVLFTQNNNTVEYISIVECSRSTGISDATIKGRLKRNVFSLVNGWAVEYKTK